MPKYRIDEKFRIEPYEPSGELVKRLSRLNDTDPDLIRDILSHTCITARQLSDITGCSVYSVYNHINKKKLTVVNPFKRTAGRELNFIKIDDSFTHFIEELL